MRIILSDLKHFNEYSQYDQFVPLNLGYLVSHIQKTFGNTVDISMHLDPAQFLRVVVDSKPQVIGFSLYTWNINLTKTIIGMVRDKLGDEVYIVVGGPSVDTDKDEQRRLFERLPGIDAIVPGEGEMGFANIISTLFSEKDIRKSGPISGVVFCRKDTLISGGEAPLINLEELDSPYIRGVLDEFFRPPFKLLMQTTRGCPYTCTYCTLGKNLSKTRKFPIEQIKGEVKYIAEKFADRPLTDLFLADDNFGLFKSDLEIADYIHKVSKEIGYPPRISYYSDKNFTETSKGVAHKLKDLQDVFCVSLQTDNPKTLRTTKRKNLSDETLAEAVDWAKSNSLKPMTELIFGLPHDTKESFVSLLEKCVKFKFDYIATNPLMLLDGAVLNRKEAREEFGFKTKHRLFMSNYGCVDGVFNAESEEIVVSSNSFSFDDFIDIRYLAFMFYAVYMLHFQYSFFNELRQTNIKTTDFFDAFLHPDEDQGWPEGYLDFLSDLKKAIMGELYDTEGELIKAIEAKYRKNSCNVLPSPKINVVYSTRLIYQENEWHSEVFKRILQKFEKQIDLPKCSSAFDFLLDFYKHQLVNLRQPLSYPAPLKSYYDIKTWIQTKSSASIQNYRMDKPVDVTFYLNPADERKFLSFVKGNHMLGNSSYYYAGVQFLQRSRFYSFNYSSRGCKKKRSQKMKTGYETTIAELNKESSGV